MSWTLIDRLGEKHKYNEMLQAIILAVPFVESDAAIAIDTVCNDPEIQKLYFPILIDASAQGMYCRHVLCRYECAPNKHLLNMYLRSNGMLTE